MGWLYRLYSYYRLWYICTSEVGRWKKNHRVRKTREMWSEFTRATYNSILVNCNVFVDSTVSCPSVSSISHSAPLPSPRSVLLVRRRPVRVSGQKRGAPAVPGDTLSDAVLPTLHICICQTSNCDFNGRFFCGKKFLRDVPIIRMCNIWTKLIITCKMQLIFFQIA